MELYAIPKVFSCKVVAWFNFRLLQLSAFLLLHLVTVLPAHQRQCSKRPRSLLIRTSTWVIDRLHCSLRLAVVSLKWGGVERCYGVLLVVAI